MDTIRKRFRGRTIDASGETFVRLYDTLRTNYIESSDPESIVRCALLDQLDEFGLNGSTRDEWLTRDITVNQWNTIQHLLDKNGSINVCYTTPSETEKKEDHAKKCDSFRYLMHDGETIEEKEVRAVPRYVEPTIPIVKVNPRTAPQFDHPTRIKFEIPQVKQEDVRKSEINDMAYDPHITRVLNLIYSLVRMLDIGSTMETAINGFHSEIKYLETICPSAAQLEASQEYVGYITTVFNLNGWNPEFNCFSKPVSHKVLVQQLTEVIKTNQMVSDNQISECRAFIDEGRALLTSLLQTDLDATDGVLAYLSRNKDHPFSWLIDDLNSSFYQDLVWLGWTSGGFLDEPANINKLTIELCTSKFAGKTVVQVTHPKVSTTELVQDILISLSERLMATDSIEDAVTDAFDVQETLQDLSQYDPMVKVEMERPTILLSRLGRFGPRDIGQALHLIL